MSDEQILSILIAILMSRGWPLGLAAQEAREIVKASKE